MKINLNISPNPLDNKKKCVLQEGPRFYNPMGGPKETNTLQRCGLGALQLRACCQQKLGRPRFSILRLETFDKTNPKMVQWTFGGCNEQCITSSCRCGRFFIFRGRAAWAAEVTQVTQVEIEEMALFRKRSWLYSNPLESTLEAHRRGKNTVFSTLKKQKNKGKHAWQKDFHRCNKIDTQSLWEKCMSEIGKSRCSKKPLKVVNLLSSSILLHSLVFDILFLWSWKPEKNVSMEGAAECYDLKLLKSWMWCAMNVRCVAECRWVVRLRRWYLKFEFY